MIKRINFFLILLITTSLFSQTVNLDNYKYVIVANKFDFLKEVNQYQTSSLTKFLLQKKGFVVFIENEAIPTEVVNNRCLTLFAKVVDESSMFTTKSRIQLEDCYGKTVYTSEIGRSKEKVYKKAFQESIRKAYASMDDFEYRYKLSTNLNNLEEAPTKVKIVTPDPKVIIIPENHQIKADKIVIDVLYAQSIENGFQLVDLKPEVVFKVLKTNVNDVFIINNKNGIFYKVGEKWFAEYYINNQFILKEYKVKF